MFNSRQAQQIGNEVRQHAQNFLPALWRAFENAIVGERLEVRFFRKLLANIPAELRQLNLPTLNMQVRVAETHQKPIVSVVGPPGFRCELADLLVVVKYDLGGGAFERNSLLYQVKLCDSNTSICTIDQNQLELLTQWPQFEFGLAANGGPVPYHIAPNTLEFGSYMLMLRAPSSPFHICRSCPPWNCLVGYGVSPSASETQINGPTSVDITQLPYALDAASTLFGQFAFALGEHHDFAPSIPPLISALYRHLGLDPDPPGEFEGYTRETHEEEIGFAIVEIKIGPGKQFTEKSRWRPASK